MTTLIPKYYQGSTGAVNRPINLKLGETISVKDFGAIGNGTTDDTTAIQAAINSLSATGGVVYLPLGNYKVSSTLSWTSKTITLVGAGAGATTLNTYIASGDIISIGNSSNTPSQGGVRDLNIIASTTQTSGAGIHLINCHGTRISNVVIGYGLNVGIQIDGGTNQFGAYIDHFDIAQCNIGISIGTDGASPQDIFISDGIIGSCANIGLYVQQGSGLYFNTIDIISCYKGFATGPLPTQYAANMFFNAILCDTSTTTGFCFFDNGGVVEQVNMVNCWGATNTNHGMQLSPKSNAFTITNFRAINNKQNGIYVQGGTNLGFVNCQSLANSMQGSALYDGIAIDGSATNNISIIGGKYGSGWIAGGINYQRYGIFISSGGINNYSVIGADTIGNVTNSINDGGTGATKYIIGNSGYVTSKAGSATISAATSVIVTHGLSATPAEYNILVTPIGTMPVTWWVNTVNSTTFTINVVSAVTVAFAWQAKISGA